MQKNSIAKKCISIIIALLALTASQNYAQNKQSQIIVGPNIQVSKDGNFSHFEYMLAANPLYPDNLIGGSITYPFDILLPKTKVYVTSNGGNSWNDIDFKQPTQFTVDPQVAFGLDGTAYFLEMFYSSNAVPPSTLYFYKSYDAGATWGKPLDLFKKVLYGLPTGNDHPQLVVDHTFGEFAGNVYISFISGDIKTNTLQAWLFRSKDGGKSFLGPKMIVGDGIQRLIQVTPLLISSKGTLFSTYVARTDDNKNMDLFITSSKDGGVTFSKPSKIATTKSLQLPQYAIDNQSEKYKDRLYCVIEDHLLGGGSRILLTYSIDEGKTWSEPKCVDSNLLECNQYQPSVNVNVDGVVGIRWYDTKEAKYGKEFNEYFTASLDGGETFLSPVKVSTETSKVRNLKKELVIPIWRRSPQKERIFLSFYSSQIDWLEGGHYLQFTSDAKGVFHDFWADGRDGRAYQIYTSAIQVIPSDADITKEKMDFEKRFNEKEKKFSLAPEKKVLSQIAKDVFLNMDEADYDTIKHILSIPVRVKNISDKPIFGPINVKISKIDTTNNKYTIPLVINASNKKSRIGAEFNYAIDNKNILLPGNETETVVWKFKVSIPKEKRNSLTEEEVRLYKKYSEEEMKIQKIRLDKDHLISYGLYPEFISDLYINVTGYRGVENY